MSKKKEKIKLDDKTAAVFAKKGYDVTNKLAEGAFGQVYKAMKTDTNTPAVVKVMHIEKIPKIVVDKFLPREFDTSTTIHHKNVIEVFDIIKSNNCYYIFMEFAPGGTIMDHIKKAPLEEDQAKIWFRQITKGLNEMHVKYKMCHRDIKPDNVLLDSKDICKLSDFGFAKAVEDDDPLSSTVCGTLPFYAPELVIYTKKYDPFAVDVWAMGVMLFLMLYQGYPYAFPKDMKNKDDMKAFQKKMIKKERLTKPGIDVSSDCTDFISRCLEPDPSKRYTTTKMLKHSWLKE